MTTFQKYLNEQNNDVEQLIQKKIEAEGFKVKSLVYTKTDSKHKCNIEYNYKMYGRVKLFYDGKITIEADTEKELIDNVISFVTNTSLDFHIV